MKKLVLSLLLILPLILNSCGGDEPNDLIKYKGKWNVAVKMISSMDGGEEMVTESNTTVEITTGENVIYIEQMPYKVKNNTISIPKSTSKTTINDVVMETSMEANGTLMDNKIEIQQTMDTKTTTKDQIMNMHQVIVMIFTK